MSVITHKMRRFLTRSERHITNGEEARKYHPEHDLSSMRDTTAFNAGRANIPG